jgi:radical SAM superfamily enzyme YgiQ (UPF0313 family)
MNILLISPETTKRPMDTDWKTRMSPPLSLLTLSAVTPKQHQIRLIDENIEKLRIGSDIDLVGITVKVDTSPRARRIAALCSEKEIPVVCGGIHPTCFPQEVMEYADTVVIGEGELLWPEVLKDAENGILRRVYKNSGPVQIEDKPVPDWSVLKSSRYMFTNTISISRGCPWKCGFCYNSCPNIDATYRAKTIPQIIREIESLDSDHVMFIDDNFFGNPVFTRKLLPVLKAMRITWQAAASANVGRYEELLDGMAEAGCKSLFIGFESINQSNLLSCSKEQNRTGEYTRTIGLIHEREMMINASLVFGFDSDDESIFPATLGWLIENRIETMTAHILTPYPGTRFYKQLLAENRIIDFDLSHYNTSHTVYRPARITPGLLEERYRWMYREFYSWKNIVKRLPESKAQRSAYLLFNLVYRKFGKLTAPIAGAMGMRRIAGIARRLAFNGNNGKRSCNREISLHDGSPGPARLLHHLDPGPFIN